MHIVHVLTRLDNGGAEENTITTAQQQAAAGHSVTVIHGGIAKPRWRDAWPKGVERVSLPNLVAPISPRLDWVAQRQLVEMFHALAPDVVHTHQSKAGILGRRAAGRTRVPTVVHGIHIVNFDNVPFAKRAIYLAAERQVAQVTDAFIGVSEAVCQAYVTNGIARERDVACVRSGFDLNAFQTARLPADAADLLKPMPRSGRPLCVAMLAALEPRKGHLTFLEAFARWFGQFSSIRLLLCGEGPLQPQIRRAIQDLGLSKSVRLCGFRPDAAEILTLADVTILNSAREGLPRAALQSLAAGTPVILPDYPGVREVVQDRQNGRIVARRRADDICAALTHLLNAPNELARLRRGAQATDLSAWDHRHMGADTTAIYLRAKRMEAAA